MKKFIIALLLVPFLNAEEVFIECTDPVRSKNGDPLELFTIRFHIKLDKQLIKSRDEFVKYSEVTNGTIFWKEVTNYDDGSWISNSYAIDRFTGKLSIFTTYSPDIGKIHEAIWYECKKHESLF